MFEERCLVCGHHLPDDGRAYCSDACENNEAYSPCTSSSSSALASPQLDYSPGGDVPPLMPSALGYALGKGLTAKQSYYASSSSASSTSWSVMTDDEDIDPYSDSSESPFDPNFGNPSALSYARRPSGTNNRFTVPQVKQKSRSPTRTDYGFPRSAPLHSHQEDSSEDGLSFTDTLDNDELLDFDFQSEQDKPSKSSKSKRSRNRASLPACFSLLQMVSPSNSHKSSPVSPASAHTVAACPSPPTPRLPHKITPSAISALASIPLSRSRQEAERFSTSHGLTQSLHLRSRLDSGRTQVPEQIDDNEESAPRPRGRPSARRNSSPAPKVTSEVGDAVVSDMRRVPVRSDQSQSRSRAGRGRTRVEDLDGLGSSANAPGYGVGRSGLLNRERFQAQRIHI